MKNLFSFSFIYILNIVYLYKSFIIMNKFEKIFSEYIEFKTILKYISDEDKEKIFNLIEQIYNSDKKNFNDFYNNFPRLLKSLINSTVEITSTKYDALLNKFLYEVDGFIYLKKDLQKKIIYEINWDDILIKIKEKYLK